MIAVLEPKLKRLETLSVAYRPVRQGRVCACDGGLVEVSGLPVPVGTVCRIIPGDGSAALSAEVIGFRAGHSLMVLLGDTVLLSPGAVVQAEGRPGVVPVGDGFLGRAVDGLGIPIDGGASISAAAHWPLGGKRESALERSSVCEPFDCGVRAINACTTMGVGQRLGVIAGSGVGKSVLIDMVAGHAEADIVVVGLIGERAREVSDFVARHMTGERRQRTAVVAVPADHAANLRLRGAQLATSLAEYYRAQGKRVLLILDSLTRVAHAAREIALLLGEPGAARGYPPSALAAITRLVERAGNSHRTGGAITGLYTVLADGDDQSDPVVDTARAILDGHIVLSRDLAQRGHYPAIDIPASLSRVMDECVGRGHVALARQLRLLVSDYESNRDLVLMGAYSAGSDPQVDRAMRMRSATEAFLQQSRDEACCIDESVLRLAQMLSEDDVAA